MSALSYAPLLPVAPGRRLALVRTPVPPHRRRAAPPHVLGAGRRRPVDRARSSTTLRVTRRGRLVATLTTGTALACAGVAVSTAAWSAPQGGTPASAVPAVPAVPAVTSVVVLPGDSLWSLAATAAGPGEDVRDVAVRIRDLNDLPGPAVAAGDRLLVPAG